MKPTKLLILLVAAIPLAACDKQSELSAAPQAAFEQSTAGRLPALSKDMAYADLRRQVAADGWRSVPDPQCKANVAGGVAICDQVTELESCSGDGYCVMHFARNSEKMAVYTYGMIEDWMVPGEQSRLRVTEWELDH